MNTPVYISPNTRELRQFGLLLALIIAIIWLLVSGAQGWKWLAGIAGAVVLASLAWPPALRPVHWLLMKFGHAVSKVLNPVLLGLVYFVIITPMGVVMRWFGYDPMRRSRDTSAASYREASDDTATHRFDRPF